MRHFTILVLLISANSPCIQAQTASRYSQKPILMWCSAKSPQQLVGDVQQLCMELKIGENLTRQAESSGFSNMFSTTATPLHGELFYLNYHSPIPSIIGLSFQQVTDSGEAERIIRARQDGFGVNGFMREEGDGRYTVGVKWNSIEIESNDTAATLELEEVNVPQAYVEKTHTYEQFYRIHDNVLYHAESPDVFEVPLQDSDSIRQLQSNSHDLSLQLAFNRIPMATRQLCWNIVNAGVGPYLQLRDGEPEQYSDVRKSSASLVLPMIKSALFDVDQIDGSIEFSNSDSMSGQLKLTTKIKSALSRQLAAMASGSACFGAILEDDAAATIHSCLLLPEGEPKLLETLSHYLLVRSTEFDDTSICVAAQSLAFELLDVAEKQGSLELLVKAGWSPESDGVVYGGIQLKVSEDSRLLNDLATLAKGMAADGVTDSEYGVHVVEYDGRSYLQLLLPDQPMGLLTEQTSLNLTHLYVTLGNGAIWFAAGGKNAFRILPTRIQKCDESGRIITPLLTVHVDTDRWLTYPQDDPSGVAELLTWLDKNVSSFPPNLGPMQGFTSDATPMLQKVRELGGGSELRLSVESDESGLLITGQMGNFIRNYWLARIVSQYEAALTSLRLDD